MTGVPRRYSVVFRPSRKCAVTSIFATKAGSLATLPDGYTVVVGGLEFANDSESTQQVPGIARVPLIGELFKSRDNARGRQRFFVFIHATVLRDARLEDLKYISALDADAAAVDDGAPDLPPRVIR
ncbi:MAG TPA: hypothetical protein VD971_05905 [Phycisphaerales bacterium]|nr:hypothetical protein [Phycisphaerales bacterium]